VAWRGEIHNNTEGWKGIDTFTTGERGKLKTYRASLNGKESLTYMGVKRGCPSRIGSRIDKRAILRESKGSRVSLGKRGRQPEKGT